MDSPITLEWEENGLHVTMAMDELRLSRIEFDGTARGVMSTGEALAFYEHVEAVLGEWYREAAAVRAEVQRDYPRLVAAREETDMLDPFDPKNPAYADNLRELGDIVRKRTREP